MRGDEEMLREAGDVLAHSTLSGTGVASDFVPPDMSRSMRILKSFSVGSWRIDSAPVSACSTSSVPCSPRTESSSTAIVNHMLKSWLRR